MTNRQKTMELTDEVSFVQETYSAPAYELFSFETSGLILSGPGDAGDSDDDVSDTGEDDWDDMGPSNKINFDWWL